MVFSLEYQYIGQTRESWRYVTPYEVNLFVFNSIQFIFIKLTQNIMYIKLNWLHNII